MAKSQVLIITRLSTQNAGNEALSKELIKYVTANLPESDVLALDRYPRSFERFRLDALGESPVAAFDALAADLISRFRSDDAVPARRATIDRVRLDETAREMTGPLKVLKRKLALRRRLAELGLIEKQATPTAVTACTSSDLVIWNPAGEIQPMPASVDHVVRLLLLLRIAQLSGRKTAVINHSLEVVDERLRSLIRHVYSQLDYIGVRDAKSVAAAVEIGLPQARVIEAPDLVFLASRDLAKVRAQTGPRAIGLAINGLEAMIGADEWRTLMTGLKSLGRPLLLVSNAMNHDLEISQRLADLGGGGTVIDHQPGYLKLRDHYAACDVLISSRLHASILSLCEGVPVVSIEPSVFKLTAIFKQMDYPIQTERLQDTGWAERVLANVRSCLADDGGALEVRTREILRLQTDRIDQAYAPLFGLLDR